MAQFLVFLTEYFRADRELLSGEQVLLDDDAARREELPPRLDVLEDLAVDRLLHGGQHGFGHRRGQVAVEGAEPGEKKGMKTGILDTL